MVLFIQHGLTKFIFTFLILYISGEESSLQWEYNSQYGQLIIRKPGVNIASDFSIKLT
jgi:hypothetical protein